METRHSIVLADPGEPMPAEIWPNTFRRYRAPSVPGRLSCRVDGNDVHDAERGAVVHQ